MTYIRKTPNAKSHISNLFPNLNILEHSFPINNVIYRATSHTVSNLQQYLKQCKHYVMMPR